MREQAELPPEFRSGPDTYEGIVPMFVTAAYYRDGKLVHSTLRTPPESEPEPGWTVQGGNRGEAA